MFPKIQQNIACFSLAFLEHEKRLYGNTHKKSRSIDVLTKANFNFHKYIMASNDQNTTQNMQKVFLQIHHHIHTPNKKIAISQCNYPLYFIMEANPIINIALICRTSIYLLIPYSSSSSQYNLSLHSKQPSRPQGVRKLNYH